MSKEIAERIAADPKCIARAKQSFADVRAGNTVSLDEAMDFLRVATLERIKDDEGEV